MKLRTHAERLLGWSRVAAGRRGAPAHGAVASGAGWAVAPHVPAGAYVWLVFAGGVAALALTAPDLPTGRYADLLLFALLVGAAEAMPVRLFASGAVSVAGVFMFAALVYLGPAAAVWVGVASGAVACVTPYRKPLPKVLFNLGTHPVSTLVGAWVYTSTGGELQPQWLGWTLLVPTVLSSAVSFMLSSGMLAAAVALVTDRPVRQVWASDFRWLAPNCIALALVGLAMGVTVNVVGPAAIVVFVLPVAVAWHTYRLYVARTEEVHRRNAQLRVTNSALDLATARLNAVLAQMPTGLVIMDADDEAADAALPDGAPPAAPGSGHRLVLWNPQMEELLGIQSGEVVGRRLAEVVLSISARTSDPDETRGAAETASAAAATGTPAVFHCSVGLSSPRHLQVLVFPIRGPAGSVGHGWLVRDVSGEQEMARAKDELVAIVSHELRTPLTSLIGFTELLLRQGLSESERHECLAIMDEEARRLGGLLDDFLDLQRLEGRRLTISRVPVDVASLLVRASAAIPEDPARPVVLDLPDRLPSVHADPARLQQVLLNLLSNARKYSPAGGPIRLAARAVDNQVEVSVADRGLGIPPEALPRLFEKFYRVRGADRGQIKGTGLGLAICRWIVEAHDGRIWAESAGLGHGTRVCLSLPAVAAEAAWPSPAPPSLSRSGLEPVSTRHRAGSTG